MKKVVPYTQEGTSKKAQITHMFNRISGRYDLLNRVLSMRIDVQWRAAALGYVPLAGVQEILDVATGTGDLALMAAGKWNRAQITGIDLSQGMLHIAEQKIKKKQLDKRIRLQLGDAEALAFTENTFDLVMVAFGVRNFDDLDAGLHELYRVTKPNGHVVILEFSKPHVLINGLFSVYFRYILPNIGRWVSKDAAAYGYLRRSVEAFLQGAAFAEHLKEAGFKHIKWRRLSAGIASVYLGQK